MVVGVGPVVAAVCPAAAAVAVCPGVAAAVYLGAVLAARESGGDSLGVCT